MYKLEGKEIIVSGWENGIADDPYSGISDIRNANISSTPKEVAVNFSTVLNSYPSISARSISSANTGTDQLTIAASPTVGVGMAITISGTNLPSPLTTGTTYWILTHPDNVTISLASTYATYLSSSTLDILTAGTPGDWTFSSVNIATPKYFTQDSVPAYWMLDSAGRVWRNESQTTNWVYTGNQVPTQTYTNGNGLVYVQSSAGTGYIFIFHNSSIDYTPSASGSISWTYQWNPSTGGALGYAAIPTQRLKTGISTTNSHEVQVLPDGRTYYCDANYIGRFYETDPTTPFDPTSTSTYTFTQTPVIPFTDICQCIAPSGTGILIGGSKNLIYQWDKVSPSNTGSPIIVGENNIVKLVTVNTNTYVFAGNRGRIYVTNGTNANKFKKIPDYISGMLEPYFTWGGACAQKNRLYFGFSVGSNSSGGAPSLLSLYKGLWSIDLDTEALIGTNELSGTNVFATAILPIGGTAFGSGLFIGWANNPVSSSATSTGVDTTSENPYSNSETYVISDMIPIGTYLKPNTLAQVEWKTSAPIGSNGTVERIALSYTTTMKRGASDNFISIGTTTITGTTSVGSYTGTTRNVAGVSDFYVINTQQNQWIQLKATMSSTPTVSPATFNRLIEIRIREIKT